MLKTQVKDMSVPSRSSGSNGSYRAVRTHSTCHEKDKTKWEHTAALCSKWDHKKLFRKNPMLRLNCKDEWKAGWLKGEEL